jgi:hypothetical protein
MQMIIFLRRKNSVIQNQSRLKNCFQNNIFFRLQIFKKIELNDNIYIFPSSQHTAALPQLYFYTFRRV